MKIINNILNDYISDQKWSCYYNGYDGIGTSLYWLARELNIHNQNIARELNNMDWKFDLSNKHPNCPVEKICHYKLENKSIIISLFNSKTPWENLRYESKWTKQKKSKIKYGVLIIDESLVRCYLITRVSLLPKYLLLSNGKGIPPSLGTIYGNVHIDRLLNILYSFGLITEPIPYIEDNIRNKLSFYERIRIKIGPTMSQLAPLRFDYVDIWKRRNDERQLLKAARIYNPGNLTKDIIIQKFTKALKWRKSWLSKIIDKFNDSFGFLDIDSLSRMLENAKDETFEIKIESLLNNLIDFDDLDLTKEEWQERVKTISNLYEQGMPIPQELTQSMLCNEICLGIILNPYYVNLNACECPHCGSKTIEVVSSSSPDQWHGLVGRLYSITFCPQCKIQLSRRCMAKS